MKLLTLLFAVAATLVSVNAASAQNGAITERFEYCTTLTNPCCGDDIDICLDYSVVQNKNGTHLNVQGSGTSTDGTKYVISANQNMTYHVGGEGAQNQTIIARTRYNATGNSDCSVWLKYTIHVTINANGDVTAVVTNMEIECENGTIF